MEKRSKIVDSQDGKENAAIKHNMEGNALILRGTNYVGTDDNNVWIISSTPSH